jgi:hypothetical protein
MSEKGPGLARKRFKVYKNQIHCMAKIAMSKRICQWFFVVNMGKTGRKPLVWCLTDKLRGRLSFTPTSPPPSRGRKLSLIVQNSPPLVGGVRGGGEANGHWQANTETLL